jgi:hypothetical protein
MSLPVLRNYDNYKFRVLPIVVAGYTLDPFLSMINHACDPNVLWHCESRSIRIIATKPLAAGDELYICYSSISTEYGVRQTNIRGAWGFTCTCTLCKLGPQDVSTAGEFGIRVLATLAGRMPLERTSVWDLQLMVRDVYKRFGYAVHAQRKLHRWIWAHRLTWDKHWDAFVTILRMYYLVEPGLTPPLQPEERLDTLFHVLNLMPLPETNLYRKVSLSQSEIFETYLQLRSIRVLAMEEMFGGSTMLARFEREDFEQVLHSWRSKDGQFTPWQENAEGKVAFIMRMNRILEWAGIPLRTDEELLYFQ